MIILHDIISIRPSADGGIILWQFLTHRSCLLYTFMNTYLSAVVLPPGISIGMDVTPAAVHRPDFPNLVHGLLD